MTPPTSRRWSACASWSRRSARWSPTASSARTRSSSTSPSAIEGAPRCITDTIITIIRTTRRGRRRPQSRRTAAAGAVADAASQPATTAASAATGRARSRPGRDGLRRRLRRPPPTRPASSAWRSIPFEASAPTAPGLSLLRVEIDAVDRCRRADAASRRRLVPLRPPAGADGLAPARLRFVYFDGKGLRALSLAEVRALL